MDAVYRFATDISSPDRFCPCKNVLSVVGLLWVVVVSMRLLTTLAGWFCAFFLAPWGITRINLKKYGPWAVVTGASEGIGRGYALELAKQGLNVVIMSRSEEKLKKVEDEIREKYQREVRIISVDFSEGKNIYPNIAEQLQDLDIGILVNNVGLGNGTNGPMPFCDFSSDRAYRMVELNCQTMIQMTKLLLPKMLQHQKGIVVNISSASSVKPWPHAAVYSSTKVFVNNFSEVLRNECRGKGVLVQTVVPCFVATSMSNIKQTNSLIMEANFYARSAVATIGIQKYTFGCLSHSIQGFLLERVPTFIFTRLILKVEKMMSKYKNVKTE